MNVLDVKGLTIEDENRVIVNNISFSLNSGQWLALIGESGSGKSITASSIGRLLNEGLKITSGNIKLDKYDIMKLNENELRNIRGSEISYVFQDYQNALTPFIKIGKQIDEFIKCHVKDLDKETRKQMIIDTLNDVGLDGKSVFRKYPFQLSGGQMQRVAIAQAIILKPKLLIADEATTALDAITTIKILDLLNEIKEKTNCALLFITHDLRSARKYADKVSIMYKGEIIENGSFKEIVENPKHDYTKNLFASIIPMEDVPDRLKIIEDYSMR
ncbi:ABC transporter ATP-binding protein [Clostridium sp.]|uniref:ABC transporter ATP-binding protein n=1 Tax=Clostridium sp. TaxID=1506 RepID=UPI002A920A5B|nr:ABC transporter ATP-binding protein [Clostridium sp.]MDY6011401.1 ABC transporter ATP-binding protein [Clostridium sp.]